MNALVLNQLENSAFESVMDRYREEFHNKLQENNPELLNFEKYAVEALNAIGVVGLDAPLRSGDEFTITKIDGDLFEILKALPKPDEAWNKQVHEYVGSKLWDRIVADGDMNVAIKNFLEWHEEEYMTILQDNEIGGHDALFDYIWAKNIFFNEDGEEVPAPTEED